MLNNHLLSFISNGRIQSLAPGSDRPINSARRALCITLELEADKGMLETNVSKHNRNAFQGTEIPVRVGARRL